MEWKSKLKFYWAKKWLEVSEDDTYTIFSTDKFPAVYGLEYISIIFHSQMK